MGKSAPQSRSSRGGHSITRSWRGQSWSISILRLWLGVTWLYAGWNKASDEGFLDQGSSHYIGAQLTGYLAHSPIAFILRHFIEHSTLVGWFVLLSEFAIGFAVLLGVWLPLVAFSGAAMSAGLWLSASWGVHPYFLGSDTAYMILWLVLFASLVQKNGAARGSQRVKALIPNVRDRRELLRAGTVGVLAVAGALVGGTFKKSRSTGLTLGSAAEIAKLSTVPVGSTFNFQAKDGSPAILFRTKAGVFAYSAICTHQGCTVSYSASSHLIECPCHGGQYDPTNAAAVVAGPPQSPLAKISVKISGDSIVQV